MHSIILIFFRLIFLFMMALAIQTNSTPKKLRNEDYKLFESILLLITPGPKLTPKEKSVIQSDPNYKAHFYCKPKNIERITKAATNLEHEHLFPAFCEWLIDKNLITTTTQRKYLEKTKQKYSETENNLRQDFVKQALILFYDYEIFDNQKLTDKLYETNTMGMSPLAFSELKYKEFKKE